MTATPIRRKPKWFWHDDKVLEDMVEQGRTDAEIAKALGRTVGAIERHRYARGLFRIRACHRKAQKVKEEILEGGVRRRLYGDLRGVVA